MQALGSVTGGRSENETKFAQQIQRGVVCFTVFLAFLKKNEIKHYSTDLNIM